ncbi:TetR/AcrR family transcriptional regulator [Burkholderia gladioli]|uniref:TetR/AcrR family transcriptional regulator n=1 Tax=Burkholderia gladioli TaxID=28095 RepID=UPI0016407139|nr:TetR/AcrR family transcriptional regulator [Burkholderia gladioli]
MTDKRYRTGETRQRIHDAAQGLVASKGFSAVGLNEVLHAASVPKGSFYHYFASKDAFGEALLDVYFEASLAGMDCLLTAGDRGMGDRLMSYWRGWADRQMESNDGMTCLVVKLGAELADISESMRLALERGTDRLVGRLAEAILLGIAEGSLDVREAPPDVALALHQTWPGASIMAKISRSRLPFENAASITRHLIRPRSSTADSASCCTRTSPTSSSRSSLRR